MGNRSGVPIAILAVAVGFLALAPVSGAGQEGAYSPPRTPWGDPDLQGHYNPGVPTSMPMETPTGEPWPERPAPHGAAFTAFFGPEAAAPRNPEHEKTMVVDPPSGIIPFLPWAVAEREDIMAKQETLEHLDPRVKCLPSALPRANLPVGYNSYQFLQVPGAVMILYEWNHLSRYIPLDGRPHVSPEVRLGMGDSRGHWEGNTLVVDVTNFSTNTWVVGHGTPQVVLEGAPATALDTGHGVFHSDALRVVERFTLVDADTIHYEATIEDPEVFARPWTVAFDAFERAPADHILYEYACHEGNGGNMKRMTGVDVTVK